MAENTNPSRIKEVQILNESGTPVGDKVKISPDAADVMVHDASNNANHASLQDFLFAKFTDIFSQGNESMRAFETDDNGNPIYHRVDPSQGSLWQTWTDYQKIMKRRLMGLYDSEGEYQGDFISNREIPEAPVSLLDKQLAMWSLTEGDKTDPDANIAAIIEIYKLEDKHFIGDDGEALTNGTITKETQAELLAFAFGSESLWQQLLAKHTELKNTIIGLYNEGVLVGDFEPTVANRDKLKQQYALSDDTKMKWDSDGKTVIEGEDITANQQARKMMIDSEKSIWQSMLDYFQKQKDAILGIYDQDGNKVGYFEPTKNNLDKLKEVYQHGFIVSREFDADDNLVQTIKWGSVVTDEEAMALIVDTSKKSVYQQLIELKDFWITLPFESYEAGNDSNGQPILGLNIANKNDIAKLHFADTTETITAIEEGGSEE